MALLGLGLEELGMWPIMLRGLIMGFTEAFLFRGCCYYVPR